MERKLMMHVSSRNLVDLKSTTFWNEKPCPLVAVPCSYCLFLAVFMGYHLPMNVVAANSSETLVNIYQTNKECCLLGCGASIFRVEEIM
jgi:hypothetical protein